MSNNEAKKPILRVENICKSFGPTKALVNVSIALYPGEVMGLIGENGSGKSTLSTIIAGIQKQDSGEMFFQEQPYSPKSLTDAVSKGVCMVVQEQGTLDGLNVAANIFASKEKDFRKGLFLDLQKMNDTAKTLLSRIGLDDIDPEQYVDALPFEKRKLLEVARAEYAKPQILLIDETTTALEKNGREVMYSLINKMRDEGRSVIFISHDIEELMAICDRITVLRDGHLIGVLEKEELSVQKMRSMMVGREVAENFYRSDYEAAPHEGDPILSCEHIRFGVLNDMSIELHKGEILGLGGLVDCGMHDLGKILFGITKPDYGRVVLHGEKDEIITNTNSAVKHKMAYISKNRDTEALMGAGSITENMCLPSYREMAKAGLINPKDEKELVQKWQEILSIKMQDASQFVMYLSGGNKQKVSIAKWMATDADVYIFDCPTRGIDIGVKAEIYKLLVLLKEQGKAVLMISEELPELIGMSDRIIILKNGEVSKTFVRSKELTEHMLIDYMI